MYDEWIRQVFDHAVTDPAWYWEADVPEPPSVTCVAFLARLFSEPQPILSRYSDSQLNQGFWHLINGSSSNYVFALLDPEVPWPQRRTAVRSIAVLFENLFARRCTNHLSHFDEPGASPLNLACYMWWDMFPYTGKPDDPCDAAMDSELLNVMKRTLESESIACQESALHGLGHWEKSYPAFVHEVIDSFLTRRMNVRPELHEYAINARRGCVL